MLLTAMYIILFYDNITVKNDIQFNDIQFNYDSKKKNVRILCYI